MGSVEKHALIAGMMWEVARLQGRHQTIAEICGRASPCTVRPDDPAPSPAPSPDVSIPDPAPPPYDAHPAVHH